MARGGAKRNTPAGDQTPGSATPAPAREKAPPPPPRPEDQLFFMRIRRRAKPVFILLALAFAGGFVLFGVGSGSSGIGDLMNGSWIFGSGGNESSTPGIRKAQDLVEKNPKDAASYRALATAYRNASRPDEAITPLTRYTELRPKDTDALLELASLHAGRASRLTTEAQIKQAYPLVTSGATFFPPSTSEIGRALATDSIQTATASVENTRITELYAQVDAANTKQVEVYKKLVTLDPADTTLLIQLATVQQQTGDTAGAIASYEKFVKLSPDDPSLGAVKERLASLKPAATSTSQVPATSTNSSG